MSAARQEAYKIYYQPNGLVVAESVKGLNLFAAHMHTRVSDGHMQPEAVAEMAAELAETTNLRTVAITDHDSLKGSERAMDFADKEGITNIKFLSGIEVTSAEGHILALGVNDAIRPGQSAAETIAEIHDKEGVAVIPHMDFPHIQSVTEETLVPLLNHPDSTPDGVEVLNASTKAVRSFPILGPRLFAVGSEDELKAFHGRHSASLAAFGGLDSHGTRIDQVFTGYTGEDPLQAIRERKTVVVFDHTSFTVGSNLKETLYLARGSARTRMRKAKQVLSRR